MHARRTSSLLALIAAAVLGLGGGVFHHALEHRPHTAASTAGHLHVGHAHAGHAHCGHAHRLHVVRAHGEHHRDEARPGHRGSSEPAPGVPHHHSSHDCAVCAMLAAGFVLQVAAPTTYYPQSCSARLHVDVPQRLERPQRAAPQLPRAPPYLLTA